MTENNKQNHTLAGSVIHPMQPVSATPRTNLDKSNTFDLSESLENLALDTATQQAYHKQDSQAKKMIAMNKHGVEVGASITNREFTARDQTNKINCSQQSDSQKKRQNPTISNSNANETRETENINTIGKQNSSTSQPTNKILQVETRQHPKDTSDDAAQGISLNTAVTVLEEGDSSHSQNSHNAKSEDLAELAVSRATTKDTLTVQQPVSVAEEFRDRLQAYSKSLSRNLLSFTDKLDVRDPQCIAELADGIFRNMRRDELIDKLPLDFLSKTQVSNEVKDTSRAFLVEWIIDVHRKFRLLPETLYVTVQLIDRYLSKKQIKKTQLHILGVTSLLIATKYEEIYPPELKDLLSVSENKFSRAEVLNMELDMLMELQFQITSPTAYRFLERFRKLLPVVASDDQLFFFAQYIQEIALLDASLLQYNPSQVAAVSLMLAFKGLKKSGHVWNKEIEAATGMLESELLPVLEDLRSFVVEVNPKFLTTLKYKFNKGSYKEVAALPFEF